MVEPGFDRFRTAARLRDQRQTIGDRLAALVSAWPKYSGKYSADPVGFAQLETYALVDYFARLIEGDDPIFRSLYVGEKAKQFHDRSVDGAQATERNKALLAGERLVFADAVRPIPGAIEAVNAAFDAIDHALTGEAKAEVKALFIGDCLFLDVLAFLTEPVLADGIRLQSSFITSHSAGEIRAQIGKLADERFDVVFYSPFTYSFLSDYEALQHPRIWRKPAAALGHVAAAVRTGIEIFDLVADLFDCPIVVHAPAPLLRTDGDRRARIKAALTLPLRARATRKISEALRAGAAIRNGKGQAIHIIDERAVADKTGLAEAGRYLFRSDLQHPAVFGTLLAPVYRDIVMVVGRLLKRKLIACDLDNTLWQGVIGEGLGIVHHYDRQAPLLALKGRGVVLAINSKNDPAKAVWEAEEGRLALDHFVSRQINWDPKPINIRRIAEHLNLKEKDFVFIDDRADERAMVEAQFPALLALDALDDRSWRLLGLWAALMPTKPNADRTEFYRQRDARQAFIATDAQTSAAERAASFAQLNLTLVIREAAAADVDRVTDLINRTNQFNMTGGRITKRSVEEMIARDDAWVLIADAADRFGAMGTISILIAERENGRLTIPIFVLSCRVFGYGMEFAILEAARRLVSPTEILFGPMNETPFNQPCRDVYATAGFTPHGEGWQLEHAASHPIEVAPWLDVEGDIRSGNPLATELQ